MNILTGRICRALLVVGFCLGGLAGCSDPPTGRTGRAPARPNAPSLAAGHSAPREQGPTAQAGSAAGGGQPAGTTGGGAPSAGAAAPVPAADGCPTDLTYKNEGCACRAKETAACWTGPLADRNVGACHDGLQVCQGTDEFSSWGPCMGEELSCGTDAGVPPDTEECPCIPGSVIQCSEDCSVGIICSLTATKTCLPDKTWSVCREDLGAALDPPGLQCRNMLHGCLAAPETTGQGVGEIYVGDCSKQFECGRAPPPPSPPPETVPN